MTIETTPGWSGIELALCKFSDHWAVCLKPGWGSFYFQLPWKVETPPREMMDMWGAAWPWGDEVGAVRLGWGHRRKLVRMPWDYEWLSTEILSHDGRVVHRETKADRAEWRAAGRARSTLEAVAKTSVAQRYPYRYVLRSGKVQEVTATVHVDRMSWGLRWWPWPVKVRTSIYVAFDGEVGERAGSWKGGTIGCGYELRPDETPEQALRRMERERIFD